MPRFGRHERENHGKHHGKHHGTCPIKVLLIFTLACYFYFLKKHQHALEDYINAGGKLSNKCKWMKKHCEKKEVQATTQQARSQGAVYEYSIVDHDKEFPEVVAPQPQVQTYRIEKEAQQMV